VNPLRKSEGELRTTVRFKGGEKQRWPEELRSRQKVLEFSSMKLKKEQWYGRGDKKSNHNKGAP